MATLDFRVNIKHVNLLKMSMNVRNNSHKTRYGLVNIMNAGQKPSFGSICQNQKKQGAVQ